MKTTTVPSGYAALDQATILGLSKIADAQKAELEAAVQQAVAQGPTLRTQFGTRAPDTSPLAALWKRYKDASRGQSIALREAAHCGDISRVALHDVPQDGRLVDVTVRSTAERDAHVAEDFSAVLKIADQRGDSIRNGRARAKAEKKAPPPDGDSQGGSAENAPKKPV